MWRWLGRGLLALVLIAAAAAFAFREEIGRLNAVLTLFDEDRITANFSAMDAAFLTAPVAAGGAPRPLPQAPRPLPERFVHGGGEEGVEAFLSRSATTSLLVLKDGAVAHESYRLGTGPEDLRMSWSVTKSFVASLIGIALAEGDLPGLDAPAEALAPELAGSAYEGVRLRDILNMASGVEFNEDYLDFWSDINQMGRVLALGASMDAFAAGQDRRLAPPGEAFRYVSIDTHVLAMILRRATGRSLAEALSEKIWIPMGAEADARMITDGHGAAFALGGLNARTRDFARFGLLIAEGGGGVVPADWIAEATSPNAPPPADASRVYRYGYQWWIPPQAEGEAIARGVYGQWIYLRPAEGVVIVKTSADRDFRTAERRANKPTLAMFRAIADALR